MNASWILTEITLHHSQFNCSNCNRRVSEVFNLLAPKAGYDPKLVKSDLLEEYTYCPKCGCKMKADTKMVSKFKEAESVVCQNRCMKWES